MKQLQLLAKISICLLLIQSCKDEASPSKENNVIHINNSSTTDIDDKQDYINKYNLYIAVWNNVTPRVEQSYTTILNMFNDKTGKPIKEQDTYYIPSLIESRAIVMLIDLENQASKIEELDGLAPKLRDSYNELLEPLQQLSDYYKSESYKDDDFEKGAELYFKVRIPFKDFLSASDVLGPQLQIIDSKLSEEAMKEYKENDQLLLYNKGMLINSLKKHSAPLYSIEYDQYKNLDFKAYDQNLKDIIKYYTDFKTLAKDKERLKREMNISSPSPFVIYYMNIDTCIKEARNLKKMALDTKSFVAMQSMVNSVGIQRDQTSHIRVTTAGERVIKSSNDLNR